MTHVIDKSLKPSNFTFCVQVRINLYQLKIVQL